MNANQSPAVSVIIPTYNRSDKLREAIESVLAQVFTDYEILVIDDGSTDDTQAVVQAVEDGRVHYFYKDNGGQSSARNLGLRKAAGRCIAYLDHDDLWPPAYLETMIRALEKHPEAGMAYTNVHLQDIDGQVRNISKKERCRSGWITRCFFEISPCLMPSATVFRASQCGGLSWDESIWRSADYDFFLRASVELPFLYVADNYIIKRDDADNLSSRVTAQGFVDAADIIRNFYQKYGRRTGIGKKQAYRKISRNYRKAAKIADRINAPKQARIYARKAVRYRPLDLRNYLTLLKVHLCKH